MKYEHRFASWVVGSFCALMLVAGSAAGQAMTNATTAALSVNGVGRLDPSTGVVQPTNSQSSTTAAAAAPIYTHRSAPNASLQFAIQGTPNKPVILAAGALAPTPLVIGTPGKVELNLATAQILVDGVNPTGFLSFAATTGPTGEWTITLPAGLPASFSNINFQGAVFDPTLAGGFRMTGTIGLTMVNTIDVLYRNVFDALFHVVRHPSYSTSLASTDFKWDGENIQQFNSMIALEMVGGPGLGYPIGIDYLGSGPNTTVAAALPTGAPTTGQSTTTYAEWSERKNLSNGPTSCGQSYVKTFRERRYELRVKEQNGAWRFAGTQREVEAKAWIEVGNAFWSTQTSGLDIFLNLRVEDRVGIRGGIAGVSCTGRQLSNIVPSGVFPSMGDTFYYATTTASGTAQLDYEGSAGFNGSAYILRVLLADALSGTSNRPLVEIASGPRDIYTFNVFWNDGTVSGPYAVPLRAAIDVSASPATALAAVPSVTTATLSFGGTYAASTTVNYLPGSFPAGVALGEVSLQLDTDMYDGIVPSSSASQSRVLCTPFRPSGPVMIQAARHDVFGNPYFSNWASINL